MPDPSAAHPAAQAATSAATDPAIIGAWAVFVAAVGLAWRRIFGRARPAAPAAPAASPPAHMGNAETRQERHESNLTHQVQLVTRLYESVSKELVEVREQLRTVATKADLENLVDRLERGLRHLEEAGERRVDRLHARFDEHLTEHGRPAA